MNHQFDVDLAIKYGINAALILNNLEFWIAKNQANETNFFDGRYWTYNSIKAFKSLFPYLSERQISTALKKLIDDGIITTGNFNKSAYDRTMWYAITEKGKSILQKCKMEELKMQNQNSENVEPIPDNKPVINPFNKTNTREEKPTRHRYGEYKNVLLTDEELEKLRNELPNSYERYIQDLSSYMASTGKSYKSHLATIRNWARKDKAKQGGQRYQPPKQETEEQRIRREQNERLLAVMGGES